MYDSFLFCWLFIVLLFFGCDIEQHNAGNLKVGIPLYDALSGSKATQCPLA